ncbi:DUF3291 domain-containing protein [Pelagibius sp. Alg239-R121]|uniref:DUF3291 domain-containing protein n=1 Tax=Pelagibius sp. Alg239-R121 TaxID=2993448 RepID=UPI0024A7909E|nr:DUF3291 domain-containing protein [Pelagibius sp. Alg239-R121]
MHLAELNIARLSQPIDHPDIADFVDNLDRINGLAERMPGFVWRFKDESGNATNVQAFEDPMLIPNLSVWESAVDLERFVWGTIHRKFYERKDEWFLLMAEHHFVMWWVEEGHLPDLSEAKARLELLRSNGPSEEAFGWADLHSAKLWEKSRCA